MTTNDRQSGRANSVGYGLVAGAMVGTAVFAFTGDVLWIGTMAAIGIVVGAVIRGWQEP